ncbi:hypothetical protein [Tabrizicola soli]|uniref:Nuclear transport factor 2 family protein n=1 Tax=Tabrizicola soli TaxID=2185115 RepID=A0ABV7DTJ1_9RHOB|nr:hypothetical protein [Tabrizicola soli]
MNPLEIFQRALDAANRAMREGGFAAYMQLLDLPFLVQTRRATFLVASAEEMRPTFDAIVNGLRARGITHYERIARTADFVARDRIDGWHYSHLIADGERVASPHLSRHSLVRRGDRWLFSQAQYDMLDGTEWPLTDADIFGHVLMRGAEPG